MSTWQIFSVPGNDFRWVPADAALCNKFAEPDDAPIESYNPNVHLPSMSDLLRDGYSKVLEHRQENVDNVRLFSTGSGKSASIKQSFFSKASSLPYNDKEFTSAELEARDIPCFSNSLFQSGTGKSVNISSASLARAKKLLSTEDENSQLSIKGQNLFPFERKGSMKNGGIISAAAVTAESLNFQNKSGESKKEANLNSFRSAVDSSTLEPHSIKFNTAGGRSLSVSIDALERAKSLLGDLDFVTSKMGRDAVDSSRLVLEEKFVSSFRYSGAAKCENVSKDFMPPLKSLSNLMDGSFETVENKAFGTEIRVVSRSKSCPLKDISNTMNGSSVSRQTNREKRRFGCGSSVSPFKRPRNSNFANPLLKAVELAPSGLSASVGSCGRRSITTRYPMLSRRKQLKEYFEKAISSKHELGKITGEFQWVTLKTIEKYTFANDFGEKNIGIEAFYHMLAQCGASAQYASKEWVGNHYKLIVWKLACYERYCPSAKFLTIANVLEELKYRYEREANHGHFSAIKKILEGDARPSSMLVLCISAIYNSCESKTASHSSGPIGYGSSNAKVELTDGWYCLDAVLDISLTKYLASGKLFVGQKLRIWGARFCAWVGPVSPLKEPRTVSLLLHVNGTYRTHWADRLGFCKNFGAPLAFRCIKNNGGFVPQTIVGVTRIYPVLYKEKLCDGRSIVRSRRMEAKKMHLHNERKSAIAESIVSEFQAGRKDFHTTHYDTNNDGARILKMLENSAEPEVLLAQMSQEQLSCFSSHQEKVKAARQMEIERAIERALQKAGLGERVVTPFLRVRVVGLTNYESKRGTREGLITIWNPTEHLKSELIEGRAYAITGLLPLNSTATTLYLQARGSSTKWQALSPTSIKHLRPFFSPRASVSLSNLGYVPLCGEFDIAAYIVHVVDVFVDAQQKKQWVFVADGSSTTSSPLEMSNSLLAISFFSPHVDSDSFAPFNHNLAGSTVCFCNLIKRAKDQRNQVWIAEATDNSTYCCGIGSPSCSHLEDVAAATRQWASNSGPVISRLKEKVLFVSGCKG